MTHATNPIARILAAAQGLSDAGSQSAMNHYFQQLEASLEAAKDKPFAHVLIVMDGGCVTGVIADCPVTYSIIDYDVLGSAEPVVLVEQSDGTTQPAIRHWGEPAEVMPTLIDEVAALPEMTRPSI